MYSYTRWRKRQNGWSSLATLRIWLVNCSPVHRQHELAKSLVHRRVLFPGGRPCGLNIHLYGQLCTKHAARRDLHPARGGVCSPSPSPPAMFPPPKTRPHLVAPIRSKCQHSAAQSPGVLQRALATCLRRVAPPRVSQGTNSLMVRNKFHTQKHGWTYHQLNPRRSINMTVPDRVL